jgi:hypothetical protein
MNDTKYIGMDVHQATISVAVRDSRGNLVMEAILETKAETILQFIGGLGGSLYVAFEEGTWAAWLHDLLQPHVARVVASDPRKNALISPSADQPKEQMTAFPTLRVPVRSTTSPSGAGLLGQSVATAYSC